MTRARNGWIAAAVALTACGGQADGGDTAEGQPESSTPAETAAEAPFRTGNEVANHLILEE